MTGTSAIPAEESPIACPTRTAKPEGFVKMKALTVSASPPLLDDLRRKRTRVFLGGGVFASGLIVNLLGSGPCGRCAHGGLSWTEPLN